MVGTELCSNFVVEKCCNLCTRLVHPLLDFLFKFMSIICFPLLAGMLILNFYPSAYFKCSVEIPTFEKTSGPNIF